MILLIVSYLVQEIYDLCQEDIINYVNSCLIFIIASVLTDFRFIQYPKLCREEVSIHVIQSREHILNTVRQYLLFLPYDSSLSLSASILKRSRSMLKTSSDVIMLILLPPPGEIAVSKLHGILSCVWS